MNFRTLKFIAASVCISLMVGTASAYTVINLDISDVEFEDISAADFTRQLTAHIEQTKGLSWMGFKAVGFDKEWAEFSLGEAAESWLKSSGLAEGWDNQKKRYVAVDWAGSELVCLFAALRKITEFVRVKDVSSISLTVGSNVDTKNDSTSSGVITVHLWTNINGILVRQSGSSALSMSALKEYKIELQLEDQPGRAVWTQQYEFASTEIYERQDREERKMEAQQNRIAKLLEDVDAKAAENLRAFPAGNAGSNRFAAAMDSAVETLNRGIARGKLTEKEIKKAQKAWRRYQEAWPEFLELSSIPIAEQMYDLFACVFVFEPGSAM